MVTRQAETSTEELVVHVAIVVLVVAETVIAGLVKREQYFTLKILATDPATESTPSKWTRAGALQPARLNGEMKRLDKKLRLKRSKKEGGMPTLKHQASKMSLLPLTMVLLALPTSLSRVVLQQSP
jgi:hypothetical protein